MLVPTIIIALMISSIALGLTLRAIEWKKTRPKNHIMGVGIRYLSGANENWSGMECVITHMHSEITTKYGKAYADDVFSRLIVEVVPFDGSRTTATTVVSEQNRIAGSMNTERFLPMTKKFLVAVILQRKVYLTVRMSALTHEVIKHIMPFDRDEGLNENHSRIDLNEMTARIESSCL